MSTSKQYFKALGVLAIAAGSALIAESVLAADFPSGTYASSDVTLVFDGKGQFRVSKGGAMKVEGEYAVNAGQLRFTDERGPWACANAGAKTGTYQWTADQGMLTFTKANDDCKERADSLTAHPWKKQG